MSWKYEMISVLTISVPVILLHTVGYYEISRSSAFTIQKFI